MASDAAFSWISSVRTDVGMVRKVNEDACLKIVRRMEAQKMDVEMHLIKGTTHGFDQEEKSMLSALEFSPEATAQALEAGRRFLQRVRAP